MPKIASASDEFDVPIQGWLAGLRGWPNVYTIQREEDSVVLLQASDREDGYPNIDEMVKSFPRPFIKEEKPLAVYHVYIPSLDEFPTGQNINGSYRYLGLRLTAKAGSNLIWPGIYIGRDPVTFQPCFSIRHNVDVYSAVWTLSEGWWTFAITLTESGHLQFYANKDADEKFLAYVWIDGWLIDEFQGWFLQVAKGLVSDLPWIINCVELFAEIQPQLKIDPGPTINWSDAYPGQILQFSSDMENWNNLTTLGESEGSFIDMNAMGEPQRFYRILV